MPLQNILLRSLVDKLVFFSLVNRTQHNKFGFLQVECETPVRYSCRSICPKVEIKNLELREHLDLSQDSDTPLSQVRSLVDIPDGEFCYRMRRGC